MEKEQDKSIYRLSRELTIICLLWVMLIFFRLDELIGAIGLRIFYAENSRIASLVLLLGSVGLLMSWGVLRGEIALLISVVLIVGFLIVGNLLTFIGWILAFVALPSLCLMIGLGVAIGTWILSRFKPQFLAPMFVKLCLILFMVYAAAFIIAAGASPPTALARFLGQGQLAGHHYYLRDEWGGFDSPQYLRLYECNAFALFCEEVYEVDYANIQYNGTMTLRINNDTGNLDIFSGDVFLYRHMPAS